MIAVVDTGPLYAVTDRSDRAHRACLATLQRNDLQLVIPAMVVAETSYLVGKRLGQVTEAAFLRGLASFDVEAPHPDDWARIAELVAQYADLRLGGIDASVVALAERLATEVVITLDDRHFRVVRPRHCTAFRLLPEGTLNSG